ncbi:hypothetical protein OH77DRAFT_1441466 [Trametes cingulata]|nr:hypothetical protein OH77DRAFT_1441466 [Trametes cingulata]
MAPGQQQQERGVKRKKPPTFQHLPAERAKKLKRSWVEVQKIKSKWKAQKRKEGLAASRPQLEHMVDAREGEADDESDESQGEEGTSHSSNAESESVPPEKAQEKPSLRELQKMAYSKASLHNHKSHPLNRHKGPATSRGRGGGTRGSPRGRGRGRGQPDMGLRMKAMLEKIKQDFT